MKTEKQRKRKRKFKAVTSKAKKKTAKARAIIKEGTGIIRINKKSLKTFKPDIIRKFIEPLICWSILQYPL